MFRLAWIPMRQNQANDTVHVPRRLVRPWTLKDLQAAAVMCKGWFAGDPMQSPNL
jgi:hypothetical protein